MRNEITLPFKNYAKKNSITALLDESDFGSKRNFNGLYVTKK